MVAEGLLTLALLGAGQGGDPPFPGILERCSVPGVGGVVECGRIEVPEDRARPGGRTISLSFLVVRAEGAAPVRPPLFFLAGGPGAGAVRAAGRVSREWSQTRKARDLVFLDPRGTGDSTPLGCDAGDNPRAFMEAVFPLEVVRECRDVLAGTHDLGAYHTSAVVEDLEAVRRTLGYERIALRGVSYGTRVALAYLARYPERVESAVLDGATPFRPGAAETFGPDLRASLRLLFADCAADRDCSRAYPDPGGDLDAVRDLLADTGVVVDLPADEGGPARLTRGAFDYSVRGMMYGEGAMALPSLLRAGASEGGLVPFVRAYLRRAETIWGVLQMGQHLSVFCREDMRDPEDAGRGETPGRADGEAESMGAALRRDYRAACAEWGVLPAAPEPGVNRPQATPVLVLSGRRDPVTPPHRAARAVAHLSSARHVVFPYGGHGWSGGGEGLCRATLARAFLERPDPDALDTSCVNTIEPAPFLLPPP